ncbi:hypothetical protein ASPWEDRAFT_539916 [Aspergillus wentii DTO 134E9]|uniref:Uncharacterized protein n=1 Tax=Aspergillus wentii DTO 134E9 TaxID=1073089 RepID=A0A1L9RFK5_ASPWE|nr:uncharacterized protein ASPWEDRAFT_539916 [Aspergillus wentii DTO 134E9]OJJ33690.1 hypothetical protein ASPWEDRAFT_539916 [Aspergillus wentii DTO 134E9]
MAVVVGFIMGVASAPEERSASGPVSVQGLKLMASSISGYDDVRVVNSPKDDERNSYKSDWSLNSEVSPFGGVGGHSKISPPGFDWNYLRTVSYYLASIIRL